MENKAITENAVSQDARRPEDAPRQISDLSALLERLDDPSDARDDARKRAEHGHQNRLIQVRLGVASSLFAALRAKHAPTAAHCLRVALNCSAWAICSELPDEHIDVVEIAALLHDVGKIAVPDHILKKPGKLTSDEYAMIEHHRQRGLEILAGCSPSKAIIDAVYYAGANYNGERPGFAKSHGELPVAARMISIVDAYDSMTTDTVYRRALSRERALTELFECSGRQFDPEMVEDFCSLLSSEQMDFSNRVARRWLRELSPHDADQQWTQGSVASTMQPQSIDMLFQQKMLESMHDAVVFVDAGHRIMLWNRAAEQMTGVLASTVVDQNWEPELVGLRDSEGRRITLQHCPLLQSIASGVQTTQRLEVTCGPLHKLAVDAHMLPVKGGNAEIHGAALILHDASSQINLEERVQSLHVKATQDPLTKIANRAEFDRSLELFVDAHLENGCPCSLIITDIDFFKKINDNYGHQAGDEALIWFAGLLSSHTRQGDVTARYGGEEFVLLCAGCDNAGATARAEQIRRELSATPQAVLSGKCITASFGVTEVQAGDTAETMLRRADRALLQAKDNGRNQVVQLGGGITGAESSQPSNGWFSWFKTDKPEELLQRTLSTTVPVKIVVEKLKGFVADQSAEIVSIDEEKVTIKITGDAGSLLRRTADRSTPFLVELTFSEQPDAVRPTFIDVSIRPIRHRDRRKTNAMDRARQLLVSLKSYLLAQEEMPGQRPE